MPTRLLQWLGVLFVLVLLGVGLGGLMIVKDRVHVTVQAEQSMAGPDPTALLRDDVQVLTRNFDAMQQALGGNFERLGAALEERATARHADVVALRDELGQVRQQLEAQTQQVAVLQTQLRELPTAPAAPPATLVSAVAAGEAKAEPPTEAQVAPLASPKPSEVAAAQKAAPKPSAGFLSFSLPTTQFHFDEPQDYVLVPELCRVGFDAKTTLHDFSGVTSTVAGHFHADFDDPEGAWTGEVTAASGSLVTGVEGRDTDMWVYLDSKQQPQIRFELVRFRPAANGIDTKLQTVRGDLVGRMSIRGQTRELTMPIHIEVDPQKRVVVTGQVPLKLSDYGVNVPSTLGVITMQDEVVIWVALRARLEARGAK